jgi:hypothetical protein
MFLRMAAGSKAPNDNADRALAELTDKIRRDSFAQGWRAAMEAVKKAADQDAPEGATIGAAFEMSPVKGRGSAAEPSEGSTPWFVLQTVRRRRGLTVAELRSALLEDGNRFSDAHIRVSLRRLKSRKLVAIRNGRWFPN